MRKTFTWVLIIGIGLLIMSALTGEEEDSTSANLNASFSAKPASGVEPLEVNFDVYFVNT